MDDQIQAVRQMPSSLEAEQAVIGSMIIDKDAIMTATEELVADDFYYSSLGLYFTCIEELYNTFKKAVKLK